MKYIGGGNNFVSGASGSAVTKDHVLTASISKNGYIYVYVSNQNDINIYFDNLTVNHQQGAILETTEYYPFGLTMTGISSKALKANYAENKYKYNDGTELENKEFNDGSGLELYATEFRMYDPQIGRFHQIDDLADIYLNYSPYVFANNNPILLNDPLGLAADTTTLPEVVINGGSPPPPKCLHCGKSPVVPGPSPGGTPSGNSNTPDDINSPTQSYKWYEYFNDHNPGGDILYEINRYNLLASVWNWGSVISTSQDSYGTEMSGLDAAGETAANINPIKAGLLLGFMRRATMRGLWQLTRAGAIAVRNHHVWGTFYKSKSDGLWWVVDKTGHGGSKFKVYREKSGGLEWIQDANEYGDFIKGKHKSDTGKFIPWGELNK